ncbi:helix-turn-helix domain-containing protein [Arachnia propionica]|uniref:helix-turn-helix domain-containing protein n=1 Tax=Arachnia propionica TaxID=1750 RepID=UPI00399CB6FB
MASKPVLVLLFRDGDQVILEKVVRSSVATVGVVQWARIVLLVSRGVVNVLVSELVGVSRPTVNLWWGRYLEYGLEGLVDIPCPG